MIDHETQVNYEDYPDGCQSKHGCSECTSYGVFEIPYNNITVDESQLYFDIRVVRMYHSASFDRSADVIHQLGDPENEFLGTTRSIEVDYDLTPRYTAAYEKDTRIEKVFGTLVFEPEDIEKSIVFKIFKRQYYEENPELTKFNLNLRYSLRAGQVRQDSKRVEIHYFDGSHETTEMNDAFYSYSRFNLGGTCEWSEAAETGQATADCTDGDAAGDSEASPAEAEPCLAEAVWLANDETEIHNKIGQHYNLMVCSYYAKDRPKESGLDTFFLRLILDSPVEPDLTQ